jgi:uncharacterized protein (TIGR02271 family)
MSASSANQLTNVPLLEEAKLVIPVIAETATITRELVETGRVRLTKTVTEHMETAPLDLRHEEVHVEHVFTNEFLPDDQPAPVARYEGEVFIVPVLREVLVKRLLLVEELHVSKHQIVTTEPQLITLRSEAIQVEQLPALPTSPTQVF